MLRRWIWCCPLVLAATLGASAGQDDFRPHPFDWPQWQGPQRTAVSRETGLYKGWPLDGPPLVWTARGLGAGFVTPSVAAGRVFLMGNLAKTEYVLALNERTGELLWKTPVGAVRSTGGGYQGPRSTPTVDGDNVYALGLNGDLVCLGVADGALRWRKDLRKDFAGSPGGWGYSESPLVDGDKVVVTPGGKKAGIVALDKKTGATVWTAKIPEGDRAGYASVIAADVQGQRQYVQFMDGGVVGVAAADGAFLWRYDEPANGTANIATPLFHDNAVFASSDYGTGGGLVKLTRTGQGTDASQVYFTKKMRNHHGGMVLVDGYLYGADSGKLVCLKFATGEVMWQSNFAGKGSIAYADVCLYYRNEGGELQLIEANPQRYVQLGSFGQPHRSDRPAWAHPVVANGRLYVADQDVLLCYDVKRK